MARGWSRSTERRRGIATLVSAVASALPGCREARFLRQRFESELGDLINAREVELRDGQAMPRPPETTISLDVTSGDFTLGAIDAVFDEGGCEFDEWDEQLLESARELAALVLIIDRAQRAGTLAAAGPTGGAVPSLSLPDGAPPIVGSSASRRRGSRSWSKAKAASARSSSRGRFTSSRRAARAPSWP